MTIKEHYFELLDFFGELFPYIFNNIEKRYGAELKAINEQFEFAPFKCKVPVVKLTFAEGIALLKENGIEWPADEDLDTTVEKKLGELGTFNLIQSKTNTILTSICSTDTQSLPDLSTQCSAKTTPTIPVLTISS